MKVCPKNTEIYVTEWSNFFGNKIIFTLFHFVLKHNISVNLIFDFKNIC